MRDYVIAGSVFALILNSEIFTLALLAIAGAVLVYKLFSAASERSW